MQKPFIQCCICFLLLSSFPTAQGAKAKWSFPKLGGLVKEASDKAEFPEGEQLLYEKVLKAYKKDDLKSVSKSTELMMKWYPSSIYVDNAVYLMSELALKKGYFAEAIKGFDFIIDQYPKANKRASAMFAKSVAYRRLKFTKPAKQSLIRLIKTYPGSPESYRAASELRIIKEKG